MKAVNLAFGWLSLLYTDRVFPTRHLVNLRCAWRKTCHAGTVFIRGIWFLMRSFLLLGPLTFVDHQQILFYLIDLVTLLFTVKMLFLF